MKLNRNIISKQWGVGIVLIMLGINSARGQLAMINPQARHPVSLDGKWKVIIDPAGRGDYLQVWLEKKPQKRTDFFEYSFEGGPILKVPGDFNSQMSELTFYEGTVWYKKQFNYKIQKDKRLFLYFGAVNYLADVYLNGEKIGSHEGGFTPFQFEITGIVHNGENSLIVKTDNHRLENGVPGLGYDWLNYGGITRDVDLIETGSTFIEDYVIQLKKGSLDTVSGWVKLNGNQAWQTVKIKIPELNLVYRTTANEKGIAFVQFSSKLSLWSPQNPKLYPISVECNTDAVTDTIGFRSIEVKGGEILLNKKPVFLKGVNIHEENPFKKARAYSIEDARILLTAAKNLGCNMVRLAHYPYSENMVREAERMGLMVWSELPVYQHIDFADSMVSIKMELMLKEMIRRDKNRCGVIVWNLSNETYPSASRDRALIQLTQLGRRLDSSRLITHVLNTQRYDNNTITVSDPLYSYSDVIAINEYIGWYTPWQGNPESVRWKINCESKPVFISEFGGEALYGNRAGTANEATPWTEEYQEQIYIGQIKMFSTIPGLCGVCPWILFDYRSPGRMHPVYQNGYNRKGLLSENGKRKKAWYMMKEYFIKKQVL